MLNHGRTLLLNCAPEEQSAVLAESIPAEFVPVTTCTELEFVRTNIMGERGSAAANYRARQLLTIIHSVPYYEGFLTDLDTQVDYLPFKPVRELPLAAPLPLQAVTAAQQAHITRLSHILFSGTRSEYFLALWQSRLLFDRLAGLALAMIYLTEDARRAVEGQ